MSCRQITLHGKEITSKTWNDIRSLTQSDEEADQLYTQLASPSFLSWFGDWINDPENASKVVTEDGEPLVVYHGTTTTFDTFKNSNTFFSSEKEAAEWWAKASSMSRGSSLKIVVPTFLNIRNPQVQDNNITHYGDNITIKEGYDGIITNKTKDFRFGDYNHSQLIVINPNQIKSVLNQGTFSTETGNIYQQTGSIKSSEASPATVAKLKDWLKRVGVEWKSVSSIVVNGKKYDASGLTDIFNKLIQIADGKENVALAEEAMHVGVEVIEQTNPALFNDMMNRISRYNLYEQVKREYSKLESYQNGNGTPDINKIKKEAIAKLLAETYIKKEEGATKNPELLSQSRTWLQQLMDWVKALIGKAGFNPFETAVKEIEGVSREQVQEALGGEELFLQQANDEQVKLFNDIKTNRGVEITKAISATEVDENGKPVEAYFVAGKEVKNRVTGLVKKFYNRIWKDGDISKSDYQKSVDAIISDYGISGHQDIEHILETLVDKETGDPRAVPLNDDSFVPNTNPAVYRVLSKFLKAKLATYPTGTKFLWENKIYDSDRDEAGTIDFLAISKEGKVSILDWKFTSINPDISEDIPWYKKKGYRIQVGEYKRILIDKYGVDPTAFTDQIVAAIPIKTNYDYVREEDGNMYPVLKSIQVGDVNVINEKKDYFLPVSLEEQTTGDPKLDALVRKLVGLRESIEERVVGANVEARFAKAEQLAGIEKAIRHLVAKKAVGGLIEQASTYMKDVQSLMDWYDKTLKGKDFSTIENKQLSDFGIQLNRAFDDIEIYTNLDNELSSLQLSDKENKEITNIVSAARGASFKLQEVLDDYSKNIAAAKKVKNILDPEVVITMVKRWFNETSKLPVATIQALFHYRRDAQNKMDFDTSTQNDELINIQKDYEDLAKKNGWNSKNKWDIIRKKNSNELIDEFKPEFYQKAKEATKAKDYDWVRENVDVEAYKTKLEANLKKDIEIVNSRNWKADRKNKEITRLKNLYSTKDKNSLGWFAHYKTLRGFPIREKWQSEEWTTLHKPENAAALRFYEWIRKINDRAGEIGYIPDRKSARTFLPFVPDSMFGSLLAGGVKGFTERVVTSFTVDEDTVGYGTIDKVTNQLVRKIPRYLINETTKELSPNLFANMALYNEFVNRYRYLSDIEGIALALGRLEKNKGSIVTSKWGKPKFNVNTRRAEIIDSNDKNADLFDRQMATLIYGQKYVESDQFDQLLGKVGGVFERANKLLGKDIFPTNLSEQQLSMNKSIDTLNNFFQMKTLGLAPLPSISNFLGGNFQNLINSGKYFDKLDFVKAEFEYFGNRLMGEEGKKIAAAMEYFLPFTEDFNKILRKHLSDTKLSPEGIQDALMYFMRQGDLAVQGSIFLANLNNLLLIDGKIINARDYIRQTPEYADRYKNDTLKEQEAGFDDKVKKVIEEHGLLKQATIIDGKLNLPSVQRSSQEVYNVRNLTKELSKKALGNMTPEEVRGVQQNVYLRSMMVFKNWIPSTLQTRYGGLELNASTNAYEWGRARTMARMIVQDWSEALKGLVDLLSFNMFSISGMGKAVKGEKKGIEVMDKLYDYKKKSYYESTGRKLDMSREDFYDLVRSNLRQQAKDVIFLTTVLSMYFAAKAFPPDDDEDREIKDRHKFVVRALDKLSDELSFYYSPSAFQQILNGSIFPSLGIFTDITTAVSHLTKEMYGFAIDDKTLVEKNYVIKYIMKSFPITSQFSSYLPLWAPDLAKDWGIKMTQESRRR